MIPVLALIKKIVCFAIDIFVENQARRDELRKNFEKFFRASAGDSHKSAEMHEDYQKLRSDETWQKDKKL